MIEDLLLGLGLVAIVEGLFLALAPTRLAQILDALRSVGPDQLRLAGLAAVALGVGLVWMARG